nr:Hsp33 family molecular chaperone [Bartonella ancashensis]
MTNQPKSEVYLSDISSTEGDVVFPFQVEALDIRGRAVHFGKVLDSILTRHQYPEPVSYLLAEALVLTVLLGTSLKLEGKFILQTHSDGPVSMLVCDFTAPSHLRGYARFDEKRLQQAVINNQTSPEVLLGKGTLALTIDQGNYTQRYQGIVALDGSSLQDVAHAYFAQSEQIPTNIHLAVTTLKNYDEQGKKWHAGGILTQLLPQIPDHNAIHKTNKNSDVLKTCNQLEDQWREAQALTATIEDTELTNPQIGSKRLLFSLFHEHSVRIFNAIPISDKCSCSHKKIKEILEGFSAEERVQTIKNQRITVTCEFCSTNYCFKPSELSEGSV